MPMATTIANITTDIRDRREYQSCCCLLLCCNLSLRFFSLYINQSVWLTNFIYLFILIFSLKIWKTSSHFSSLMEDRKEVRLSFFLALYSWVYIYIYRLTYIYIYMCVCVCVALCLWFFIVAFVDEWVSTGDYLWWSFWVWRSELVYWNWSRFFLTKIAY